MAYLTTTYCTDEDVAIRAPGDFALIVPESQRLAYGTDGAFDASDRWTLASATNDFVAYGVAAGQVCLLSRPTASFGSDGQLLAVESAVGGSLTLRRLGQPAGVGLPPGPAVGLTGITFIVKTLGPQIENVAWELDSLYGVDEGVPTMAPSLLYAARELRQASVLMVLSWLYPALSRQPNDDFDQKGARVKRELSELQARLAIHWKRNDTAGPDTASRFTTRVNR